MHVESVYWFYPSKKALVSKEFKHPPYAHQTALSQPNLGKNDMCGIFKMTQNQLKFTYKKQTAQALTRSNASMYIYFCCIS